MKKYLIILIIFLTITSFESCTNTNSIEPDNTVNLFLQEIYTVDNNTAREFADIYRLLSDPKSIGDTTQEKVNQRLDAISKRFKPITTIDIFKASDYFDLLFYTKKNKCTFKCSKVSLTPGQIQKDYKDFSFTVKLEIIKNDNKTETEEESGIISAVKKDDKWKVNYFLPTKLSKIHYANEN